MIPIDLASDIPIMRLSNKRLCEIDLWLSSNLELVKCVCVCDCHKCKSWKNQSFKPLFRSTDIHLHKPVKNEKQVKINKKYTTCFR